MRIVLMMGLAAFCLFSAGSADAAGRFEFAGGLAVPTGELDEFYDTGMSFSAAYIIDIIPYVGFGVNAGYNHVSLNESAVSYHLAEPSYELVEGGGVSTKSICAEIRLQSEIPGGASLWGVAGGGMYFVNIENRSEILFGEFFEYRFPSEKQTGGYIGAGFAVPVAPMVQVGAEFKAQYFPLEHELRRGIVDDSRTLISVRAVVRVAI